MSFNDVFGTGLSDENLAAIKAAVSVIPAVGIAAGRGESTSLVAFVGETVQQTITVYQSDGVTAYNLAGKTLAIIFETRGNADVDIINDVDVIGDDNNVVTFDYTSAVTANVWSLKWTLRDAAAPKTVYLTGVLEVRRAAQVDV
jgi:hypothetical protein